MSEPRARVSRHGRWTYSVYVEDGLTRWGPDGCGWLVFGRNRAEAKGRRVLRRYLRTQAEAESWTVTLNDEDGRQ